MRRGSREVPTPAALTTRAYDPPQRPSPCTRRAGLGALAFEPRPLRLVPHSHRRAARPTLVSTRLPPNAHRRPWSFLCVGGRRRFQSVVDAHVNLTSRTCTAARAPGRPQTDRTGIRLHGRVAFESPSRAGVCARLANESPSANVRDDRLLLDCKDTSPICAELTG